MEHTIEITVSNVVCTFHVKRKLDLQKIGRMAYNVQYKRQEGRVEMRLRYKKIVAFIYSSGKVTCFGAGSEQEAKIGAKRVARSLSQTAYPCINSIFNFKIINILGSCEMPFAIRIEKMPPSNNSFYSPESHSAREVHYEDIKATCMVFTTGKVTVFAPNSSLISVAIERLYPVIVAFQREKTEQDYLTMNRTAQRLYRKYHQDQKTII